MDAVTANPTERTIFWLFMALIIWAPMPFASNRPWALALLAAATMALLASWLALYYLGKASLSRRAARRMKLPLVLLALMPLWALVQTLPLPREIVSLLSPRTAYLHLPGAWIPLSLDLAATRLYMLAAMTCLCAFTLVLVLINCAKRTELLLWTLVASGSFQAIYGSMMVLTGLEWGFLVEKYSGLGVATGTFVNRNHLAGYLVMCLAAGTGLLLSQLSGESIVSARDFARKTLSAMLSSKIIIRLLLAIMVIALVLTRSRMGNTAFFAGLAIAGILAMWCGRKLSPKLMVLIASLLIVDLIIVGQWFGLDQLMERLETAAPESEYRLAVQGRGANILADFPLTGSGGGSYHSVFTYYQDAGDWGYYRHAHNDYLEIAAEMGIPVFVALAVFLTLVFYRALQLQRVDHSRLQHGVGFTLVMVFAWVLIHSAFDFNLQIPANSMTLCIICGLAFANLLPAARLETSPSGLSPSAPSQRKASR